MEGKNLDTCGCCEGVKALTPVRVRNVPGLSELVYRVGTHASFKMTMQSALSKRPPLRELTTRDDDDPAIALCDAWAAVLDVLCFYQERIANEGYLRTATERRSILEMARSIGYELRPGVAAGTYLAFTLEEAPGSPLNTIIDVGNKVQSVPGQDELPQVFETIEEIKAKVVWNALKPRLTIPHEIGRGTTRLHLEGTDTRLQPGDALLFVGEAREHSPFSERWDFRILQTVAPDAKNNYTLVTWKEELGHKAPTIEPADNPRVFAFRLRAALFGHNAPDWKAMPEEIKKAYNPDYDPDKKQITQWKDFKIRTVAENIIDLDVAYPGVLKGSWIVLTKPNYVELYKALDVAFDSRTDFTLTSKTTRINLDTRRHLNWFGLRETLVFAHSEQIEVAKRPITTPVFGEKIVLDQLVQGLDQGHTVVVSGKPLRYVKVAERKRVFRVGKEEITEAEVQLFLVTADGSRKSGLKSGDILEIVEPPVWTPEGLITWHLMNDQGFSGFVTAETDDILPEKETGEGKQAGELGLASEEDQLISEVVMLERTEKDDEFTILVLGAALQNVYRRDSVTINANVARATHGETKTEVLGSGDGSQAFQKFKLKQKPLTYVSSATASGAETTLEIRVNDVLWKKVSTFFSHGPDERIYVTQNDDDGVTTVIFGDGQTGARLPTGQENVKAKYRVGIGLSGLLKANQLEQPMTRPLGLKAVTNPIAPTGADNPEERDKARRNAPFTVLTLDRIVSLQDYEDFARAFAGIGKAQATLLWNGERKIVHITVAAADGGNVGETSDLYKNLIAGIDASRHRDQQVLVDSYKSLRFDLKARVQIDSNYIAKDVLAAILGALKKAFAFDVRDFGQAVMPSEVLAIMQRINGVVAIDLDELGGKNLLVQPHFHLLADIAHWDENNEKIEPAELLTINPDGIALTEIAI